MDGIYTDQSFGYSRTAQLWRNNGLPSCLAHVTVISLSKRYTAVSIHYSTFGGGKPILRPQLMEMKQSFCPIGPSHYHQPLTHTRHSHSGWSVLPKDTTVCNFRNWDSNRQSLSYWNFLYHLSHCRPEVGCCILQLWIFFVCLFVCFVLPIEKKKTFSIIMLLHNKIEITDSGLKTVWTHCRSLVNT